MVDKIYTIGHSNRTINAFIKILIENKIHCLIDVRSFPGSRTVPHFNKENLEKSLEKYNIKYYHLSELGGRRKPTSNTHVTIETPGFAGYADYMDTKEFHKGLNLLKKIGKKCRSAYMCAEGKWWQCHRRMISDKLVADGWNVYHLGMGKNPVAHEIWDIARIKNGKLIYDR